MLNKDENISYLQFDLLIYHTLFNYIKSNKLLHLIKERIYKSTKPKLGNVKLVSH